MPEAQLRQNALEMLLQEVFTNIPGRQMVWTVNIHAAGKLPLIRCSLAFLDEFLLDLSHPNLQESLRLSIICLLESDSLPGELLRERHDGYRDARCRLQQVYLSRSSW